MKSVALAEFIKAKIQLKNVLVVGLGIQGGGLGVVRFMLRHGANVSVYDDKPAGDLQITIDKLHQEGANVATYYTGGEMPNDISKYSLIIKGPSVKWDHPLVTQAEEAHVEVAMETSLFIKYAPCQMIGITGTRGKSTTTMMIYEILSKHYKDGKVYVSGNVPGTCALDLLDVLEDADMVVLELSSWQLAGCHRLKCSPHIAVLTNIFEDHMNYYTNMHDYIYDKTSIYAYQNASGSDTIIATKDWANEYFAVTAPPHNNITYVENDMTTNQVHLKGQHNIQNSQLAKCVCKLLLSEAYDEQIDTSIANFKPLTCRQELIAKYESVDIINDSTSTTPVATITAIRTFADRDIYLVLGGNTKHLDAKGLLDEIARESGKIKHITLLSGSFTSEIVAKLEKTGVTSISMPFGNFKEAIKDVFAKAKSSDTPCVLLFSPGATSFAQFRNEFHRGEEFTRVISDIIAG